MYQVKLFAFASANTISYCCGMKVVGFGCKIYDDSDSSSLFFFVVTSDEFVAFQILLQKC